LRRVVTKSSAVRAALVATLSLVSAPDAGAQNLFELLFGSAPKQQPQPQQRPAPPQDNPVANFFADPFGLQQQQPAEGTRTAGNIGAGGGPGFCVRTCDGKFFPLMRGAASPAQICQAFCPQATTKIYYGSQIEYAAAESGERYADSANAFAFRKALKTDCTCTGRGPAGLAQVDLSLDTSLRPGDVVATGNGLAAYSGSRGGGSLDFTPVASFPGLTSDVRARLGEMKVSPNDAPATASVAAPPAPVAQSAKPPGARRAAVANASPGPGR
jgi:hypothetical protein